MSAIKPIESTGHKPTDEERAIEAVRVSLVRIQRQTEAALVALAEVPPRPADQPDLDAELVSLLKQWSDMHGGMSFVAGVSVKGDWFVCNTVVSSKWIVEQKQVGFHPTKQALIAKLRELTKSEPTDEEVLAAGRASVVGNGAAAKAFDLLEKILEERKAVK
jgi:hypothetical protein